MSSMFNKFFWATMPMSLGSTFVARWYADHHEISQLFGASFVDLPLFFMSYWIFKKWFVEKAK